MALHQFRDDSYSGFSSSPEILAAIEEIAGDDIRNEDSEAYRIWAEPSDQEIKTIEARAFQMTKDDTLAWGETTVKRR